MAKCTEPGTGELLHAYEVGALSEADVERFEIHLLHCKDCFEQVRDFQQKAGLLFEDDEVKEAVRRIDRADWKRDSPTSKLKRYLWPHSPFIFKPAVAYFLVLLLIGPAYLGLRQGDPDHITEFRTVDLTGVRSTEDQVLRISGEPWSKVRFWIGNPDSSSEYHLTVVCSETEDTVLAVDDFTGFDEYGLGEILLYVRKLSPGRYRLTIGSSGGGTAPETIVYSFAVRE